MSIKLQIIKLLGKISNLFFSEKRKFANKLALEDSEENILSDDTSVSEGPNNFFQNATKTLNINENSYIVGSSSSITDPVDNAINARKIYPSILLAKQKLENMDHFSFKEVSISETEKELREVNFNKTVTCGNIPTKIFKQSSKSCADTLQELFNDALRNDSFLDKLKCADERPVFKKDESKEL